MHQHLGASGGLDDEWVSQFLMSSRSLPLPFRRQDSENGDNGMETIASLDLWVSVQIEIPTHMAMGTEHHHHLSYSNP